MSETIDKKRFWLGAVMMIAGIAMLFIALFIEPMGEIHGTVLGAFGEIATIAGAILGLDSYVNMKMKRFIADEERKKNEG
jgi:membrane associated rhomboid family serine protease